MSSRLERARGEHWAPFLSSVISACAHLPALSPTLRPEGGEVPSSPGAPDAALQAPGHTPSPHLRSPGKRSRTGSQAGRCPWSQVSMGRGEAFST